MVDNTPKLCSSNNRRAASVSFILLSIGGILADQKELAMRKTIFLLFLSGAILSLAVLTDVHGQKAAQPNLPDGPGKEILQNACTECHDLQMVVGTGYDKQEWQLTLERMITAGANVTPDQIPVLTDYLLKNMAGEGPRPAKIIPGPV